jgi:hypothetical protein
MSAVPPMLLQKSKVAPVQIFGETLKREAIDDSDDLSRATEVAERPDLLQPLSLSRTQPDRTVLDQAMSACRDPI